MSFPPPPSTLKGNRKAAAHRYYGEDIEELLCTPISQSQDREKQEGERENKKTN